MSKPVSIAIVEDETAIAQMYAIRLRMEGYTVETAPDGETGIALILRMRPDIVLLDIMMPNMNGTEVISRLNQYPEAAHCKIIVLTNIDSPVTDEEVKRLGAVDYLVKADLTPEQVAEKVKNVLVAANVKDSLSHIPKKPA